MAHFVTHFTPEAAMTSVLVPSSPWGACSPPTYKLLCSSRCFLMSPIDLLTLLCAARLWQQLTPKFFFFETVKCLNFLTDKMPSMNIRYQHHQSNQLVAPELAPKLALSWK